MGPYGSRKDLLLLSTGFQISLLCLAKLPFNSSRGAYRTTGNLHINPEALIVGIRVGGHKYI